MKSPSRTDLSKLIKEMKSGMESTNLTLPELEFLLNEIYKSTIIKFKDKYPVKGKTFSEIADYSDLVISLANSKIVVFLASYALDVTPSPYEISAKDFNKLKSYYYNILKASSKQYESLIEVFQELFNITHAPSVINSIKHREKVIQEKNKIKGNKKS